MYKLFVLRIVTWSKIYFLMIIIIGYLKAYNCVKIKDCHQIEIVTWNHIVMNKILVLDRNTWNHTTIGKLSGLDKNHHHHVVRLARISLTLSLHVSRSFIASGRSSGLHPVSSHSCCMYVWAGRPAFDWPYAGVHRCTSLTISSLLLQQSLAYMVRLACIVFVIGGRWPYSWYLVGCCHQDLFNIALNILI